ncbi:MAG: IS66 family transposase [Pseudonocardiaceae bacterium]
MGSGPQAAHDDVVSLLAAKNAENTALRTENAALLARVTELEGIVAALQAQANRDSSNSGRPPSSDSPFTKKPAPKRSVRGRSGKPQGKQPGTPGITLHLVDDPDEVIVHSPGTCLGCGAGLDDAEVFAVCRHQVVDTPPQPPRPHVSEHQVQSRTCQGCGTLTEATAPGFASGRVQYGPRVKARAAWLSCAHFLPVRRARGVVNALGGFAVSDGWVAGLRGQAARLLETRFIPHVRALISTAPVAHADETTARAAGGLRYLHVACTRFLTVIHAGDRTKQTIDAGGVWPAFTGVIVRDGYAGYEHLTAAVHAWCGIHLIRDLRSVHDPDPTGQVWAEAMVTTLIGANDTAHAARAEGRNALTDTELATIRSRYAGAIARGWDENTTGRDPLHEQARTLLRRFERHQDMILRFTVNLAVPFTNNTAELPARSAKVQQRTSGGSWRTLQGLIDFAVVQSYLSTATKWGIDTLDAMTRLLTTGAWLPPALTPEAATQTAA